MSGNNVPDTYYNSIRTEMQRFIPTRRRRVLEIGCGEGRFSASLPGVEETWGIEPSTAAEEAKTRMTRVFQGTFDQAEPELPLAYFDVVACNDVIEHLPDHEAFLRGIQKHIAPGGALVGSIPNVRYYRNMFQYLVEKDWHYADSGILDRTHTAFFTQKSLRKTLERCRYTVARMEGVNAWGAHSARDRLYLGAAHALKWMTGGYFADILHLQFAFQAVPEGTGTSGS